MRIPNGNFGNSERQTIDSPRYEVEGQQTARATQVLANAGANLALQMRQEDLDMARAKGATALADHELFARQTALDTQHKVEAGELNYSEADNAFNEQLSQRELPKIENADRNIQADFDQGIKKINGSLGLQMQDFVFGKQQEDYKGQFVSFLDTQGKLAGMPGADVAAINASAAATANTMAERAGIPAAQRAKYIQDFQDGNWYNHANETLIKNRNNLDGLRGIETALTADDGFYQGKLDTNKRNALLSQAMSMRTQLENKIQIAADRRDVKAQRALLEMEQQTSTGVPATAQQMQIWGALTSGTQFADAFKESQAAEQVVQQTLRLPVDQQLKFVQTAQADLAKNGGTLKDIQNVNRLTTAVQKNVKQLQESPLLYAEARTGETIEPLDVSLLMRDDGQEIAAGVLRERVATIGALRKQYGPQVQARPLLPQEADMLIGVLNKATPAEQANIFNTLAQTIGNNEVYQGAMQQIAPDSPVKALAGNLMKFTGEQTTKPAWIGADQTITAARSASTMLAGEAILNKSKDAGKTDGKPVTLPIPSEKDFAAAFQGEVGTAFAGRPQAFQAAMQAARAFYVGQSSTTGDFSTEIDTRKVRDAVRATLGTPVEYKNNTILLPWGMDESTFQDKVKLNLNAVLHERGLTAPQINNEIVKFPRMDLINFGDGEYMVLDGARRPYLIAGKPVTVKVDE